MTSKELLTGVFMLFVLAALPGCGGGGGGGAAGAPAPSAPAGLIALPKTGQTTCSDTAGTAIPCTATGQDGALQTGVAEPSPRFTVDGTGGCVTDHLTGLMWTRDANLPPATQSWQQALAYANNLNLCGFSDWRLSNLKELRSLVSYSLANNAVTLNTLGFSNVQAASYWSSTTSSYTNSLAWAVYMLDGNVFPDNKTTSRYVWPVRAGQ